ncbi:MAG: peptidoglycan-associated lipoprotein Pal [Comamonadaceae bacterium]|nr:MAG: peptidoglycan-associated lipoprotein Pal [Comamonadaceae bacterium]
MKNVLTATVVAVLLTACGSAVKLDNVGVEDRTGKTTLGETQPASKVQSVVASTDASKSNLDAMNASNRVIYFDFDSFAIRTEFQSALENHARLLKSDKTMKISIDGHTDERGGREYNLSLGQKRSEAVRKALALLGVSENQMEAVSFGKEKPAVEGSTEAAMEKNRRAEINYR